MHDGWREILEGLTRNIFIGAVLYSFFESSKFISVSFDGFGNFCKNFVVFFTASSSGQRNLGWAVFCCLTFFIGVAMAEESDTKIRQNSIVSIFDEFWSFRYWRYLVYFGVVITKFECI